MKTTMRFLVIIMVLAGAMELAAQTDSTAPYWKTKLMPKIDIQKTDSGVLTNLTIKKGQN
ncbi:MAG: hypothetical protein H7Y27_03065, partial [Gemmatimonadaceae bacterium]|nr:hypothetical protein [Chitinophagaceae bacterium]